MISKGADMFTLDNQGRTLMHQVAIGGSGSMYGVIRDAGVSKKDKDNDGKMPYEIAVKRPNSVSKSLADVDPKY